MGGNRVGVRIGPGGTWNGMSDSNPEALFDYVAKQLNRFGLAYLHVIEPRVKGNVLIAEGQAPLDAQQLRKTFKGKIIAAGGFEPDSAEAIVEKGDADLVAFGRHFLANPDLPKRIRLGLPLNENATARPSTLSISTATPIIRSTTSNVMAYCLIHFAPNCRIPLFISIAVFMRALLEIPQPAVRALNRKTKGWSWKHSTHCSISVTTQQLSASGRPTTSSTARTSHPGAKACSI